jgi:hypothetical protein
VERSAGPFDSTYRKKPAFSAIREIGIEVKIQNLADYREINGFPWLFGVKAFYFTKMQKSRLNRAGQPLKNERSAVILLGGHRAARQLGAATMVGH